MDKIDLRVISTSIFFIVIYSENHNFIVIGSDEFIVTVEGLEEVCDVM